MSEKNQARLRLVVIDGVRLSRGYKSGRSSDRETPDTSSSASTRSAGTRPEARHFCTAWYRTPSFSATARRPPPPSIARSTASMPSNLQPPVAIRQQLRVAAYFSKMQPMVVDSRQERERFAKALNERVAREHPEERGRPQWLQKKLKEFIAKSGRRRKVPSVQTCAYWLAGTKIARVGNDTLLCDALGMTRGELFGETSDARLAAIIECWNDLPEHQKNGMYSMVVPPSEQHGELEHVKEKRRGNG